jgi:hypothetical protein
MTGTQQINNLILQVQMEVNDANARIDVFNARLANIEEIAAKVGANASKGLGQISEGLGHGVSSIQATSGALRILEGNFTQNLRAAERFVATTLGLGSVLQNAFPVIGGIAFLGMITALVEHAQKAYEWFQRLQDAPGKLRAAFLELNGSIRVQNDQLAVTNDHLQAEINKLSGKPGNGLKLALDEARLSADRLGESLLKDLDRAQELLDKKENKVGSFAGRVFGTESTQPLSEWQKQFNKRVQDEINSYNIQLAHMKPGDAVDEAKKAHESRLRGLYQSGLDNAEGETAWRQRLQQARDVMSRTNRPYSDPQWPYRNNSALEASDYQKAGLAAPDHGMFTQEIYDQTPMINGLQQRSGLLAQELSRMSLTTEHEQLEKQKGAIPSNTRDLLNAEKEAQKALIDAQTQTKNPSGLLTSVVEKMQMIEQQGNMSLAALQKFQQAVGIMAGNLSKFDISNAKDPFIEGKLDAHQAAKGMVYQTRADEAAYDAANVLMDKQYQAEQTRIDESKKLQLDSLTEVNAQTLKQKLAVEEQKYQIEKDYVAKSLDLELSKLSADTLRQRTKAMMDAQHDIAEGGNKDQVNQALNDRLGSIQDQSDLAAQTLKGKFGTQQQAAQDAMVKAQTKLIQDQYKTVYDGILKQSTNFLEALEDSTNGGFKRMAESLKKTFLDAFNNIIASRITQKFMALLTGNGGSGELGKQGGLLMGGNANMGGIGSLGTLFGLGGIGGGGISYPGAPGGTPGFAGPVTFSGGGGSFGSGGFSSGGGGGGIFGSLFSGLGGFGGSSGGGGSFGGSVAGDGLPIAAGPGYSLPGISGGYSGPSGSGGLFGMLGKLFGGGANGAHAAQMASMLGGGAMLMSSFGQKGIGGTVNSLGGGGLMGYSAAGMIPGLTGTMGAIGGVGLGALTDGIKRGGIGGMFESAAGGAGVGAAIGSIVPGLGTLVGGLIGAGAGLLGGLFGLLKGNPLKDIKKRVKQSYGITIQDSEAQWILDLAKQKYGGSIDLALSSAEVRQAMSAYSAATGQFNNQISSQPFSYTASSAGGMTSVMAGTTYGYSNTGSLGGILPTNSQGFMAPPNSSPVHIQLDGAATTALLQGQIATGAPGAVANSYSYSQQRMNTSATLFSPGLVTR